MAVFSREKEKWQYVLDIPLTGNKLDKVLTLKNKNENSEFLIIGTIKDSEKIYNVYTCKTENFKKIYSSNYNFLTLCDVNLNENPKLITLGEDFSNFELNDYNVKISENINEKLKSNKKNKYFMVNEITENGVKILNCEKFEHYAYANNVEKYEFNSTTLNCPCLFLTLSNKDSKNYAKYNFVLNFSNNNIKIKAVENVSYKDLYQTYFFDINKDKKLEIANNKLFPGYPLENLRLKKENPNPFITTWGDLTQNNEFSIKQQENKEFSNTYIDFEHEYGLKLPERWKNKVTAKFKNNNKNIDFFVYENSLKKDSQKLLTINLDYSLNKETLENGFFILSKNKNITYVASIYPNLKIKDENLKITKKELKNMFFKINWIYSGGTNETNFNLWRWRRNKRIHKN